MTPCWYMPFVWLPVAVFYGRSLAIDWLYACGVLPAFPVSWWLLGWGAADPGRASNIAIALSSVVMSAVFVISVSAIRFVPRATPWVLLVVAVLSTCSSWFLWNVPQ